MEVSELVEGAANLLVTIVFPGKLDVSAKIT